MGMMPLRLTSPTVGFMPARPLMDDGETMEPSVSVPTVIAHRFAEAAAPDPELEPDGLRSRAYGLRVCPPRRLHPLVEWRPRKLAHSLQFVLPRITAPAARSRLTRKASFGGREPTSASDPAVVCIRSEVAMLSFIKMGIPWSEP